MRTFQNNMITGSPHCKSIFVDNLNVVGCLAHNHNLCVLAKIGVSKSTISLADFVVAKDKTDVWRLDVIADKVATQIAG